LLLDMRSVCLRFMARRCGKALLSSMLIHVMQNLL
jgi:hypothetical protein